MHLKSSTAGGGGGIGIMALSRDEKEMLVMYPVPGFPPVLQMLSSGGSESAATDSGEEALSLFLYGLGV